MIEALIGLGINAANLGVKALGNYLDRRKKKKELLTTVEDLDKRLKESEEKWKEVEVKVKSVFSD